MKRFLPIITALLTIVQAAVAHIGSPNVFFEEQTGGGLVYAVIRPPPTLPGVAQASVRVKGLDATAVSLTPVMWQSGREGSPQPVIAQRVSGETNLWSAEIWLLRPGSYTVQIKVEERNSSLEVTVPLNAAGLQSQQMKPGLRLQLSLFGLLLVVAALFISNAISREGCLEIGVEPSLRHCARGRRWAVVAALLLVAGVAGGAVRWRNMDVAYRANGIQKPEPIQTAVTVETDRAILELRRDGQSMSIPSWAALVPDHGKLMHMFLVRQPELDVFAHVHPIRRDADTFALELPALPKGSYQLYAETTFETGMNQTLIANVTLPEPVGAPLSLPPVMTNLVGEVFCGFFPTASTPDSGRVVRDMDDSWHVGQGVNPPGPRQGGRGLASRLMGGYTLLLENADEVVAGTETALRFSVFAPDGSEVALQPYMGMRGHAAARRADGSVFAHLHPTGSFSMASQEVFRQRENASAENKYSTTAQSAGGKMLNSVSFPYQFPKGGQYRIWMQVRVEGRVLTGVFDLEIKSGT